VRVVIIIIIIIIIILHCPRVVYSNSCEASITTLRTSPERCQSLNGKLFLLNSLKQVYYLWHTHTHTHTLSAQVVVRRCFNAVDRIIIAELCAD